MSTGVPPLQTIVREAWEEAGVAETLARKAAAAGTVDLLREVPEGVQSEVIFAFDLRLPDFQQRIAGKPDSTFAFPFPRQVRGILNRASSRSITLDARGSGDYADFLERLKMEKKVSRAQYEKRGVRHDQTSAWIDRSCGRCLASVAVSLSRFLQGDPAAKCPNKTDSLYRAIRAGRRHRTPPRYDRPETERKMGAAGRRGQPHRRGRRDRRRFRGESEPTATRSA